ncbi:5040_t:CDS:1 [Entrophospora sp. SA101]|nr:9404_t:CDS:1 [Entrophospora sp. SA101]CAJ0893753.1 5040_t:CDS:1 [Entrophospora sp. SA101]CAJ0895270.1 9337_t:CDS:1 [Entrophospora sp. SA101]CAJ0926342.1 17859_t:CDS:1 [Entrophospora sp. SA101]CAJ0926360.1 17866_t:CDS:1 [Entrophospora sp. SA101]
MDPETKSCVDKARLNKNQAHFFFNPPCKVYSQISDFILPNPNNVNSISIPKSPNSFFLYRKNYIAKHKSPRNKKDGRILSKEASVSWKNELKEVKVYFKVLAKVAFQKHKITYENRKNRIFIPQQPGPQQKQIDNNNDSAVSSSPYPNPFSFPSTCHYTNNNTSSSYQQLELQQKQKDNDDCVAYSSSTHPHPTFFCTSNNTSFPHLVLQQLEPQQNQKVSYCEKNNNDCATLSSLLHPHSTFFCTNDNINFPHFVLQQLEPQQNQKDNFHNNDCAVSLPSPYPHFTSFCTSDNASLSHFMSQQPELQQNQIDNFHNNDCAVPSPSPHPHSTFFNTNDNTSLPHFMPQQLEIQQNQIDNFPINNCAASSSPYFDFNANWNTINGYFTD